MAFCFSLRDCDESRQVQKMLINRDCKWVDGTDGILTPDEVVVCVVDNDKTMRIDNNPDCPAIARSVLIRHMGKTGNVIRDQGTLKHGFNFDMSKLPGPGERETLQRLLFKRNIKWVNTGDEVTPDCQAIVFVSKDRHMYVASGNGCPMIDATTLMSKLTAGANAFYGLINGNDSDPPVPEPVDVDASRVSVAVAILRDAFMQAAKEPHIPLDKVEELIEEALLEYVDKDDLSEYPDKDDVEQYVERELKGYCSIDRAKDIVRERLPDMDDYLALEDADDFLCDNEIVVDHELQSVKDDLEASIADLQSQLEELQSQQRVPLWKRFRSWLSA